MTPLFRPLVLAVLSLLSGLLLGLRLSPPPVPLLLVSLGALAAAAMAVRVLHAAAPRYRTISLLLAFFLTGGALGAAGARDAANDCRMQLADGTAVSVVGLLGAGHRTSGPGELPPLLPLIEAQIRTAQGICRTEARVRLPEQGPPAPAGTHLAFEGEWRRQSAPVARTRWPRRPIYTGFIVAEDSVVMGPAEPLRDPLLWMRGRTEGVLQRLFPGREAMAEALLLGRREHMDPAVRDRFARAGLAHLLAISGMHVGLIAGVLLLLGGLLRLSRERAAIGAIALLAGYLLMIGAPASAIRAGIMISLVLTARALQRPSATLPLISAAALFLMAREPLVVLDPGFQLSFGGVFGILVISRTLLPRLPASLRRSTSGRVFAEGAVVSAAAFLATAPIAAHHFGMVAPVAIIANLPAVPLMSLALIGIGAAALLEPILPSLARLFAAGAQLFLDLLDRVATIAGSVPYGHMTLSAPDWTLWLVASCVVIIAFEGTRRLRPAVRRVAAAGSMAAVLLAWPALVRAADQRVEVHFLDVGQGDATAIRTPRGSWILVDAGPRLNDFDAGERRVVPFLRRHRVERLEALILTHPDADHIGGAPAVLRAMSVARVIEPGLAVGKANYDEVLELVEHSGTRWIAARSGRILEVDGVTIRFLWPDAEFLDGVSDANQISAVVRVEFGDLALLLTGDVDSEVERRLATRHGSGLRAGILKAGHHGSRTSTSEELLDAVRPQLVVISSGRRNRYGHPAPEVLERLGRRGIDVARTDEAGTITVRASAGAAGGWNRID